jgi:antitoxin HicB
MKTPVEKGRIGQSFDAFLKEEGWLEESTAQAVKRAIAHQLAMAMKVQHITRADLAKKPHTSRSQLDRLLDPEKTGVMLEALTRAAHAVGRELQLELK